MLLFVMQKNSIPKVGVVGFGRFGSLWAEILAEKFDVVVFDINKTALEKITHPKIMAASSLSDFYKNIDVVFFAVPISTFDHVIQEHAWYFRSNLLVSEVLSVKVFAKQIFEKYLPDAIPVMLTHPMFGPDSFRINGVSKQPIVMDKFRATPIQYEAWKKTFEDMGFQPVEMTAEEHDKLAARSQGVAHFIGRMLEEIDFGPTPIDTFGAKRLQELMVQTCNDTWDLFSNLQNKNPYTKEIRQKLREAFGTIEKKLEQ